MTEDPETLVNPREAIDKDLKSIQLPTDIVGSYRQTTALIPEIVDEFRGTASLEWNGTPVRYEPSLPYALQGPELVYIDYIEPWTPSLVRRAVKRRDGGPLDEFQRSFLFEFQAALAMAMAALLGEADRLIAYVSQGLVEQAITGVLASLDGTSGAFIFHQNLLWAIKRLLLSTYEGAHATIAVVVIPGSAAPMLRWSKLELDGIPFLLKMKSARALSDGQNSVFAFSATGEFFGLFERQACLKKLHDITGVVEWRIRHALTLSLRIDGHRRLELFSGSWRYLDDEAAQAILKDSDPSFQGPNRLLWQLALVLSESRRGGLLLVIDDPATLVADSCCDEKQVNLRGASSRVAARLSEFDIEGGSLIHGLSLQPRELILEQFRDQTIEQIGLEILSQLAAVDGALIVRSDGTFCGFGIILSVKGEKGPAPTEGARTQAAKLASKYGVAIKISEDGPITIYKNHVAVFQ